MGQQQIAGFAVLVALAFLAMALSACTSSEQVAHREPIMIAKARGAPATPEFHGAHIGDDALRDRLASE